MEPADDLAGLRVANEYGERAKVVVSGLTRIIGAETIADYGRVGSIKLIGHGDVCTCPGIVIRHVRLLVRPSCRSLAPFYQGEISAMSCKPRLTRYSETANALDRLSHAPRCQRGELPLPICVTARLPCCLPGMLVPSVSRF